MRLFWTPASPFVRKVMTVVHETGLAEQVEIVPTVWPHEWATRTVAFDPAFIAANPVGRIPALVTEGGVAICESNLICRYLATRAGRPELIPGDDGDADLPLVRLWGLSDGAIEAMIAARAESLRSGAERSPDFIRKQMDRIGRCFDSFDVDLLRKFRSPTVAHFAAAIACAYMDFRFPDEAWRTKRPRLVDWYEGFSRRQSMTMTKPAETPQR
jgi:glutathione S-transferase